MPKNKFYYSRMERTLRFISIILCLVALFTSFLPHMSVRLLGLDDEITVFGLSELFSVLGSFDLNRTLASVNITPLAEGISINTGVVNIPVEKILKAMKIQTLSDVIGEVNVSIPSFKKFAGIQWVLRFIYMSVIFAVIFSFTRFNTVKIMFGLLLAAGMYYIATEITNSISGLQSSINAKAAQILSIYPDSVKLLQLPWIMFTACMMMYSVISICQLIHAAQAKGRAMSYD